MRISEAMGWTEVPVRWMCYPSNQLLAVCVGHEQRASRAIGVGVLHGEQRPHIFCVFVVRLRMARQQSKSIPRL